MKINTIIFLCGAVSMVRTQALQQNGQQKDYLSIIQRKQQRLEDEYAQIESNQMLSQRDKEAQTKTLLDQFNKLTAMKKKLETGENNNGGYKDQEDDNGGYEQENLGNGGYGDEDLSNGGYQE